MNALYSDNHAILGGSDLDQDTVWKAKLKCKIAIPLLHKIVSTGEYPKILKGLIEKRRMPYRDKFMAMFGIGNTLFAGLRGGYSFQDRKLLILLAVGGALCALFAGLIFKTFHPQKQEEKPHEIL